MTYAKFARLAALGALGATAGLVALFLLLIFLTRPTSVGGINWSTALVTWVSVGVMIAILAAVHLVLGRELMIAAKAGQGERTTL